MGAPPLQASLALGPLKQPQQGSTARKAPREDPVMARAGRILARRSHSTREIRDKLWAGGFPEGDIDRVVARLTELGLLDDLGFARRWVEERSRTRGLGVSALEAELEAKGIGSEVARRAIDEAELDEEARAEALASAYLRKLSGKAVVVQARRIQAMLLRKGFSVEAALTAVRAVLPPEGWD